MDLDLTGKHALVCGASQGIGRATADALAELGATVTLLARDAKALDKVRAELSTARGQKHHHLIADFDHPAELATMLAKALPGLPPVNILINNSGGPPGGAAQSAALDEYRKTFERHLMCNQVLVQAVLPGMRKSGYGRIVNIISTSVKEPIKGLGVSNSIRGAVAAWAKTLSIELGPDGITVNNLLPGFTRTQRLDVVFKARMEKFNMSRAAVEADALAEVPLGRFAEPEEPAAAIAFLCSPAAAYISGVSLAVDGGRMRSI
jgi:3-oxoacyl-[acyl-carrier protein] reductase